MDILWYNYDLSDPRDNIKCIKHIEKICRISLEYDEWQRTCKYKDSTDCPICDDNYYDYNSKCESHHHPRTLFDIVEEILEDHLEKNDLDETTGFSLVQEVMDLHLLKKVSYINLCQHCHKKYHAGHPDVKMKMDIIFQKREQVERDKDVEDEVEDIEKAFGPKGSFPTPPLIESLNINTRDDLEKMDNLKAPDIPIKEPKEIHVETVTDFVSINIEDL